jgi:uncharacterized protein (TIGR02246 family)
MAPLCIAGKLLHNLGRIGGYGMIRATICAMLVVASMAGQESATNDTAALTGLEKTWNDAQLKLDAAALGSLFADDITVAVPGMPEMSKTQALGFLQSGRMRFDRYETSGIRVRVYGDAAVVTGKLERARTVNGQTVNDTWLFTKTYIRVAGAWRVVAFHASDNN